MGLLNLVDLKDTAIYKRLKPQSDLSDERFAVYVLYHHSNDDAMESSICSIQDSHNLKDFIEHGSNVCIEIPVGSSNPIYDGIYDIWLRNCKDVTSISVAFEDVEVPITEFKLIDESIQIPLAFMEGASRNRVNQMFRYIDSELFKIRRVSYIPSLALQFDRMCIKLNKNASCDVVISTLYFQLESRRRELHNSNIFYVNGTPLITRSGKVIKYDDNKDNGCIIF